MKARELTYERLNGEYLQWALNHGDERDNNDIRFGQMLHNKYDMSMFNTDVFYKEGCEDVYSELLKDLYERTEK